MRRALLLLFAVAALAGACPLMQWHGVQMTWNGQSMTWGPQCYFANVSEALVLTDRSTVHAAHGALVSEALVLTDRSTVHAAHGALVSEALRLSEAIGLHAAHATAVADGSVLIDYGVGIYLQWKPVVTDDHYAIYVPQILFVTVKK